MPATPRRSLERGILRVSAARGSLMGDRENQHKRDFFVSYNGSDQGWAEWIAWEVEDAGYTTVIQAWDFQAGSNFVLEMQRAARETERTLAVLSDHYLQALYTQPEWAAALHGDPLGVKRALVPVRIDDCQPEGLMAAVVFIDLVALDERAARARLLQLLEGVQQGRSKPRAAPRFPGVVSLGRQERPRFPGQAPDTNEVTPTPSLMTHSEAIRIVDEVLTQVDRWSQEHGLPDDLTAKAKEDTISTYLDFVRRRLQSPGQG
jgi:TIR domain